MYRIKIKYLDPDEVAEIQEVEPGFEGTAVMPPVKDFLLLASTEAADKALLNWGGNLNAHKVAQMIDALDTRMDAGGAFMQQVLYTLAALGGYDVSTDDEGGTPDVY